MLTQQELMLYALAKNKKLELKDFKGKVQVWHNDGSHFSVANGCVERIIAESIVIVYGEHSTPMIFYTSDIKIKTYGK